MKSIAFWAVVVCAATIIGRADARAQENAPAKRVVLHGIACSDGAGEVCVKIRPVLDEAAEVLSEEQDGAVAIHLGPDPEIGTNQPGRDLAQPSAAAVREYLMAAGITPELFELR